MRVYLKDDLGRFTPPKMKFILDVHYTIQKSKTIANMLP